MYVSDFRQFEAVIHCFVCFQGSYKSGKNWKSQGIYKLRLKVEGKSVKLNIFWQGQGKIRDFPNY